jgi:acetolactate synthase-1/3 small subunit
MAMMSDEPQIMRHVIAALVMNEPGVLAQVAGMFAARGFNIDSLVVGRTENAELSRMTIVVVGDNAVLEQVRKQLQKLVPVVKVVDYLHAAYVERDMVLVQISTKAPLAEGSSDDTAGVGQNDRRSELIELANLFRAKVVDVSCDMLMIELAGTEEKIEAFIELAQPYGIVELARTGVIAMPRGKAQVDGRTWLARSAKLRSDDANDDMGIDEGDLPPG